jgi:hypothetical protein
MSLCFNCRNRATYQIGQRPFCVDCAEKMSQIAARQQQEQLLRSVQSANMLNFLLERAESLSVGPAGFLGRMPVPQIAFPTVKRDIILNNIKIDRSTIGVLNTGQMQNIEKIDVNISRLGQTQQTDTAEAFRALTEAIVSSGEISKEQRSELVEQLQELSSQSLLQPAQRKTGVIRAVVTGLASTLNTVSALATIWATWGDTIRSGFGL